MAVKKDTHAIEFVPESFFYDRDLYLVFFKMIDVKKKRMEA